MKSVEIKSKVAEVLAERFLRELKRNTPVEKGFVEGIRPAVLRLFKELPEEKQALLMYFIKQHGPESATEGLIDLKWFVASAPPPRDAVDRENLERVRKQIQYVHGVVASTMLVSYGGLGEDQIAVEG